MPDRKPALEILYTKRGRIADVISHDGLDQNKVAEIRQHVEADIFADASWQVSRRTVFAWRPIRGAYRRKDEWQLSPVPPEAPQPDELFAPHPAIFEVRYRDASDLMTRVARRQRAETRALGVLNGLVHTRLRADKPSAHKEWVVGDDPPHHVSSLKQVGYFYEQAPASDTFTSIGALRPIKFRDDYYENWLTGPNDEFDLPADLTDALDIFDSLDPATQHQFLRASYWAAHADFVRVLSKSASMIAAISSVEALAVPKEHRTLVSGEVGGSTKAFNDVIIRTLGKEYLMQHDLYDIRSNLAHGSRLLLGDAGGMPWGGMRAREEDQAMRFVQVVLPLILHDWLGLVGANIQLEH